MNKLLILPRVVFSVYGMLLFIAILLVLFPFIVIASAFGKLKGGNIIYRICQFWSDTWLLLLGIHHHNMFKSNRQQDQPYVFVFNHLSFMDVPIIMKSLKGRHFRVLGKAELAKVPIFGFVYRNAVILVNRADADKRARSVRQLKSVINKGISVVIAPEGTFNTTGKALKDFYDGAFKIAIETQTPIKPLLFLDAYHRLSYKSIFSLTPGRSRTVFLEEVSVQGLTLNDVPALKERVYQLMETKLIEYKAAWITNA
jgi:1-acyl-sn-glycerol-3-phosphate acyltransferase